MTAAAPFDTGLPSPIQRLAQLRAQARESVVRDSDPTAIQRLMAPAGILEDALWEQLGGEAAPRLLVLTGSAGCGKSALINHLLEREHVTGAGRIGQHLADATHADSPDQQQAERLATFFAAFADGAEPPSGPCQLVALNTGMALRFFHDLPRLRSVPALTGLETLLRRRLGLPLSPHAGEPADWLHSAVLVVNLDHRPTAGAPGDLFEQILKRLDPSDQSGVLEGATRCETCGVRDWCWPMANAVALSSAEGRSALNTAAGDVALKRGRQLSPRSLWDAAAELALAGIDTDGLSHPDPCYSIAEIALARNESALVSGLACSSALDQARQGTLLSDIAARDPGYVPSRTAHELISDAGLAPDQDGQHLRQWLSTDGVSHPAVLRAADAISSGRVTSPDSMSSWGRVLARAAWLNNALPTSSGVDETFANALSAQGKAFDVEGSADDDALDIALTTIEEGLAAVFGLTSGPEHFFPTSTPAPGNRADILVQARLVQDGHITTEPDPVVTANRVGSLLVRYRPVALSLIAGDRHISVDYPLWCMLRDAASGAVPSTVELERFLALRQAIRTLGVKEAAAEKRNPLLVRERTASGRKFRIITRTTGKLRATEVL